MCVRRAKHTLKNAKTKQNYEMKVNVANVDVRKTENTTFKNIKLQKIKKFFINFKIWKNKKNNIFEKKNSEQKYSEIERILKIKIIIIFARLALLGYPPK